MRIGGGLSLLLSGVSVVVALEWPSTTSSSSSSSGGWWRDSVLPEQQQRHSIRRPTVHRLGEANTSGSWLSRLGWGLGEAEVSIVERDPVMTFPARVAFFGTAIPRDGVVGHIIPLSSFTVPCFETDETISLALPSSASSTPPHSSSSSSSIEPYSASNPGCPRLCPHPPSRHPGANETWFALVQRGECDFATKAREAQRLGAKAVIVGGSDESLLSMSSREDASDVAISATYIAHSSYMNITALVDQSATRVNGIKTVSVLLVGGPPWEWYTPILSFLVVLTFPSLLTLCTLLIHRARAARAARLERAPEDVVRGLPSRVWNGSFWEKEDESLSSRGGGYGAMGATARSPVREPVPTNEEENKAKDVPRPRSDGREQAMVASGSVPRPGLSGRTASALALTASQTDIPDAHPEEEEEEEHVGSAHGAPHQTPPALPLPPPKQHVQHPSDEARPPWFASQMECAICLSTFEVGDRVRVLPCGHIFHLTEIDEWLIQQRKVCPVCKMDVTTRSTRSPTPLRQALSLVSPSRWDVRRRIGELSRLLPRRGDPPSAEGRP